MYNSIDNLPKDFVESLFQNFVKNVNYLLDYLDNDKNTVNNKINKLNVFIGRLDGYEGEILLKHKKYIFITVINTLSKFSKTIENQKLNNIVNHSIDSLMEIINTS